MSPDLLLLVPRTDFMLRDEYDLLDCILISAGFIDDGPCEVGEHSFRQYLLSGNECLEMPAREVPYEYQHVDQEGSGHDVLLYSKSAINESTLWRLSTYGLRFSRIMQVGGSELFQYTIDRSYLDRLAELCPNGIRPSKRMVEEYAYFKFLERGCHHGMDVADWFAAEWECQGRIDRIVSALNQEGAG